MTLAADTGNGNGKAPPPWWATSILFPLFAMVVGGAIVWGQTKGTLEQQVASTAAALADVKKLIEANARDQKDDLKDALESLDKATQGKFDAAALLNAERLSALSARLNEQEKAIREATVTGARTQEQLASVISRIDQRGAERERQISDLVDQMRALQQGQAADRAVAARMGAQVDRILGILDGSPALPPAAELRPPPRR